MAERVNVATKVFIDGDGNESRHASPAATVLRFAFTNGVSHDVSLSDLPDNVRDAAAWHGISQKLGDSYASAKGDADEAVESFETLIERLKEGEWVKAREGGARPSLVRDAVAALLVAKGEEVDEARLKAIAEKIKGKENREAALANPAIKAEYEKLKAKAAADRAKKAAEAAKGADEEATDLSNF